MHRSNRTKPARKKWPCGHDNRGRFLTSLLCLFLSASTLTPWPVSTIAARVSKDEQEATPPSEWAPELLDAILSSPNHEAQDALYRAAFAAGPAIAPQLEAALKDDRTAEFAAQSLAYIGGDQALGILWKLVRDPRDLNLRRFYYGALGEFTSQEATQTLLNAIKHGDEEVDRTVTQAAILALTVRSDATLIPPLKQAQAKIKDVVIRDDLDSAIEVIEWRARYLASPAGKKSGGSIDNAVRTYFMPALEPPPVNPSAHSSKSSSAHSAASETGIRVEVQTLTFSPDKTRALARVIFEDPSAEAAYDIVLQKRFGNWTVASVWLGSEAEKAPTPPPSKPPAE